MLHSVPADVHPDEAWTGIGLAQQPGKHITIHYYLQCHNCMYHYIIVPNTLRTASIILESVKQLQDSRRILQFSAAPSYFQHFCGGTAILPTELFIKQRTREEHLMMI